MVSKQSRALQAFRRVEAWFAEHPAVIPASGSSAQALANQVNALTSVITRMTEQASEQVTQKSQASLIAKDEVTLCDELRDLHIKSIVTVANALRGQVPGVGAIRMPTPGIRSEALSKAAEALYTTASVYRDVFAEQGLPKDFLEQLAAATAVLKSSIDARGVALSTRTGATTSLAGDYKVGRKIVSKIDASLAHALKNDPVTLAAWRQVQRITVKPGMPRAITGAAVAITGGEVAITGAASAPLGGSPLALVTVPSAPSSSPDAHGPGMSSASPESAAA